MPKIDENEILRRLKLLSQVAPTSQASNRVMQRLRDYLMKQETQPDRTATKIVRAIINRSVIKFAAAAVLLICAGVLIGRLSAPQQLDAEQLRADLVAQMTRQLESILEARHAQLREQIYRQVRRDLTEFAAQTLTASRDLTDQRLVGLIRLIEAARTQDRLRVASAFEQVELNRLQDKSQLGNGLQALVVQTSELLSTKRN